mmetsp:Transcript_7817/g.16844  ORF Transcript_7817/g.16844 Transcript_7817/m.16844 type:complete len:267 (-) Transcript_7817:343-1143(-)
MPRAGLLGLELTSLPVLWKRSLLMRVMGARRAWARKCLSLGERSGQNVSLFWLAISLPVSNPLPRPPCPWPPWKSGRLCAPRSDLAVGVHASRVSSRFIEFRYRLAARLFAPESRTEVSWPPRSVLFPYLSSSRPDCIIAPECLVGADGRWRSAWLASTLSCPGAKARWAKSWSSVCCTPSSPLCQRASPGSLKALLRRLSSVSCATNSAISRWASGISLGSSLSVTIPSARAAALPWAGACSHCTMAFPRKSSATPPSWSASHSP